MIDEKKLIEILSKNSIFEKITNAEGKNIFEIIDDMPKTDWIPCEVEMPKERDSMFAKAKGTDKWNDAMFEKISDEVNVTVEAKNGKCVTTHAHTTGGRWNCDLLKINKSYRIIAWQPLPQPYKKEGAENE